jgi:hypothetical protein
LDSACSSTVSRTSDELLTSRPPHHHVFRHSGRVRRLDYFVLASMYNIPTRSTATTTTIYPSLYQ